ncbi:MFS transporter [Streptomyces sp. BK022]|uniref:MFS transporter n=1 Tax=Streptomyces sp. BK022 TaxID=2512123 RepID=UPI001029D659|nr:MFS transporter [Streptomyces sp. BK022]
MKEHHVTEPSAGGSTPWSRPAVLAVTFATFLSSAAFYLNFPILPLYVAHLGHGHVGAWLGPIVGVTFLVSAIVNPFWGALADRFGQRAMMLRAAAAVTVVYALTPLAVTPSSLFALRVLAGLASGFIPAATALLSRHVPEERLGRTMSLLSVARNAGALLGPAVGTLLTTGDSFVLVYAVAAALMALCFLLALFVPRERGAPGAERPPLWDRHLWLQPLRSLGARGTSGLRPVLAVVLLTSMAAAVVQVLLPLQLAEVGGASGRRLAGLAFSVGGVASLLTAYGWGRLTDRLGTRVLLLGVFTGGAAASVLLFAARTTWTVLAAYALYCVVLCEVFTLLTVALARRESAETRGTVFGLNNTVMQLGQALGPTLAGFAVSFCSPTTGVLLTSLLLGGSLVVTATTSAGDRPRPHTEQPSPEPIKR